MDALGVSHWLVARSVSFTRSLMLGQQRWPASQDELGNGENSGFVASRWEVCGSNARSDAELDPLLVGRYTPRSHGGLESEDGGAASVRAPLCNGHFFILCNGHFSPLPTGAGVVSR